MFSLEEDGDYETSMSGGAFCGGLVATGKVEEEEKEEEERVVKDEEEIMSDDLSIGTELDSSELDAFESSFSSLSPRESLERLEPPSTRNPSVSLPRIGPTILPKHQSAAQCSPPASIPSGSRRSLRLGEIAKNSTAKRTPRDFVKEQNLLLLHWRSQGISYKTIKERLGIDEAESTLRGRLRTLTKPKNERLRRPQWTEKDVCLFYFLSFQLLVVPVYIYSWR